MYIRIPTPMYPFPDPMPSSPGLIRGSVDVPPANRVAADPGDES